MDFTRSIEGKQKMIKKEADHPVLHQNKKNERVNDSCENRLWRGSDKIHPDEQIQKKKDDAEIPLYNFPEFKDFEKTLPPASQIVVSPKNNVPEQQRITSNQIQIPHVKKIDNLQEFTEYNDSEKHNLSPQNAISQARKSNDQSKKKIVKILFFLVPLTSVFTGIVIGIFLIVQIYQVRKRIDSQSVADETFVSAPSMDVIGSTMEADENIENYTETKIAEPIEPFLLPHQNTILFPPSANLSALTASPSSEVDISSQNIVQRVFYGEQILENFERIPPLHFSDPIHYTQVPGVFTFRGNNFRNAPSWGNIDPIDGTLSQLWEFSGIGSRLSSAKTYHWSGTGWTGQPLIIQWNENVRTNMNLYPEKGEKKNLVEVIIAAMDGKIYFFDLENGEQTRDPINLGVSIKGTPALDPRGYPLLYVGHGDLNAADGKFGFQILSLLDGSSLYYQSGRDSRSFRSGWGACDSSPIIHAESDTLIYPSENGMIYTVKLNTQYDENTGTISLNPESIDFTYRTDSKSADNYGIESSISIYQNYGYFSDNGGNLICIDLNNMQLVWLRQLPDDSDITPVISVENGNAYLYVGTEVDWQRTDVLNYLGSAFTYKINAMTGDIVWQTEYPCYTHNGVSRIDDINGGLLATPISGKKSISNLVIFSYCMTDKVFAGNTIVAYDKESGAEVWKYKMSNYSWSSPIDCYDENGNAYIIIADSAGTLHMLDGLTGNKIHELQTIRFTNTSSASSAPQNFESSPAIFGNILVIGSRSGSVYGIEIK